MLAVHAPKGMIILTIVGVFLSIVTLNTKAILIGLHQDNEISHEAGRHAFFTIPSISSYGLLQCLAKFFQTQNIVVPMLLCSGTTALLHALLCWVLVFKSKLEMRGAALAISISYWTNVLLMALLCRVFFFMCQDSAWFF